MSRIAAICVIAAWTVSASACDKPAFTGASPSSIPTALTPLAIPVLVTVYNWLGESEVLTVAGPGPACGWGTRVGDIRSNVAWNITVDGSAISLDEDMQNWPTDDTPYKGTVGGEHFEATYYQGDDYLRYACQFKGGTLAGQFNAGRTTFDATESLAWGPPGGETTITRRWTGQIIPPRSGS